jgi:hypothetical protein
MEMTSRLCIEEMHKIFLLIYTNIQQRLSIKKTRSDPTTPTHPATSEDHVNKALCPEKQQKSHIN